MTIHRLAAIAFSFMLTTGSAAVEFGAHGFAIVFQQGDLAPAAREGHGGPKPRHACANDDNPFAHRVIPIEFERQTISDCALRWGA